MSLKAEQSLQKKLEPYLKMIEEELIRFPVDRRVPLFYEPIQYVLKLPGKRIRPLLVLLSTAVLGEAPQQVRSAAAAVELLHNFTLVHDDIMDNDDLRRGQPTLHKKWDLATAILAGDGLMGLAFRKLLQMPVGDVREMARRFTETMLIICEGQGLDKMFEQSASVSSQAYLDMIARKTAVLLQLSCELGALAAEANAESLALLSAFGYELGLGFQIQDDWLDILGDQRQLGKKVGSDLERHKQTILALKLQETYPQKEIFGLALPEFKKLLYESGLAAETEKLFLDHYEKAYDLLRRLPDNAARVLLWELTDFVRKRSW